MTRKTFLSIASFIASSVGCFALFFPALLHVSKGTLPNSAAYVWTSEVGILLLAIGVMAFLVRKQGDSPVLSAFFVGNFMIQIGLFVIELSAYHNKIITKLSGVLPNLTLHILLAFGFAYYLCKMKRV
jgi:hypothetical protein